MDICERCVYKKSVMQCEGCEHFIPIGNHFKQKKVEDKEQQSKEQEALKGKGQNIPEEDGDWRHKHKGMEELHSVEQYHSDEKTREYHNIARAGECE